MYREAITKTYNYQYAGRESDAERHVVNYELRQYDGRLARWHNPDSFLQHYSPYVAMGNDPVNRIDPSGGTDYYVDGMKVPSAYGSRMMNEGTNILHIEVAMDEMGMFDIGAKTHGVSFYGGEQANFAAGNLAKLIDRVGGMGNNASVDRSGNLTITRDVTVVEQANIKENKKGQVLGMDWVISSVEVEEIIQSFEGLFEGFRPTKTATHEHFIFTGDQEQNEEDGKTIIYQRTTETDKSTTGTFSIPGTNISGHFIEPAGPSTTTPNLDRRIPAGTYNLQWHNGADYQGVLKLSNSQVPASRAILIHIGNYPSNTTGCLLPGCSVGTDVVWSSGKKLRQIINHFKTVGVDGATIIIRDPVNP